MSWKIIRIEAPKQPQLVLTIDEMHGTYDTVKTVVIQLSPNNIVENGFVKEPVLDIIKQQYEAIEEELNVCGDYLTAAQSEKLEKTLNKNSVKADIDHEIKLEHTTGHALEMFVRRKIKSIIYQDVDGRNYNCTFSG